MKRICKAFLLLFLILLVVSGYFVTSIWLDMPNGDDAMKISRKTHIRVQKPIDDNDRIELIEIQSPSYVDIENTTDALKHAIIASEDHRFYTRSWTYMLGKSAQAAAYCAAKRLFGIDRRCAGNSTISQQVVKQYLVSQHRSGYRKLIELIGAIKLEVLLTKQQILEIYLNRVYFGNGNYGVGLASRFYFGKVPAQLTLEESLLLASSVQTPIKNPRNRPAENRDRANVILRLMHQHRFLETSMSINSNYVLNTGHRKVVKAYSMHQWFWMKDEIVQLLRDKPHGEYRVWTTQDAELQIYSHRNLRKTVKNAPNLEQGGVVIMRPSGEVLAMVGGAGKKMIGRGRNRTVRNETLNCPPATSTMKLVTYLMAIEHGLNQHSKVDGSPFELGNYRVRNPGNSVYATMSLASAFVASVNTVPVRLLHEYGFKSWINVARRLGLPVNDIDNELGIAIGQSAMCLLEMTAAYATISNNGYLSRPHSVIGAAHQTGHIAWKRKPQSNPRVVSPRAIQIIDTMLRGVVVEGTGKRAGQGSEFLGPRGKTGTADNSTSASFIGYTHTPDSNDLVIGVWLGNDIPAQIPGLSGGREPAELFNRVLVDIVKFTHHFEQ